jgi:predicted AlkP superfamily phosphohydrolase/phosphomutase
VVGVFVFDAASVPLVERMLADGRLPNLADLRARGRWETIEAPATYFGDRETAHSGADVVDHGQTFPLQWSPAEQRLRPSGAFPAPESVWERVARCGGRSLVIDPYEGHPPARPVGIAVSGWQFAHTAVLQRWASPPRAYRALSRRFGRAPEVEDAYGRPSLRGLEVLRRQLLTAPRRVADLATDLLARDRYDLAWIELSAGHLAGHHFWDLAHLVDGHLDQRRRAELEATVAETYSAIDTAIGHVVSALPPDADIVVFSEVGMDASHSWTDLLAEMLARVLTGARRDTDAGMPAGRTLWNVRAAIPARARLAVTRALPDAVALDLSARLFMRGVDWSRTRAFALPADHDGYVRLNLRGREREGVVDPGDADALVDEIRDGLASFTDHDGTPCVAGVDRVDELFGRGARSDQLPDLIVRWTPSPVVSLPGVTSPRFGDVRRRGMGLGRSGNHVDGSWVLTVPARGRPTERARAPRLVDVTATVASLLGAESAGLAGEPLLTRATPAAAV